MASWQTDNQSEPNNVNISEVLLEVIKSRKQRPIEGEGSQPLEKTAGLLRKNKGTADQEASAEGSRLRKGKARVNLLSKVRLLKKLKPYCRLRMGTAPMTRIKLQRKWALSYQFWFRRYWVRNRQLEGNRRRILDPKEPEVLISTKT